MAARDCARPAVLALVTVTVSGARHLLMTGREDSRAVPGGPIGPGETALRAALRVLREEAGLDAMAVTGTVMAVLPPRAPGEAVTWPVRVDLVLATALPALPGGASRAAWVPAGTCDALLRDLLDGEAAS
jgi:ADP-ribose pyrophosphatase YjhB (NUDIX family)